jgi:hypothetical protein
VGPGVIWRLAVVLGGVNVMVPRVPPPAEMDGVKVWRGSLKANDTVVRAPVTKSASTLVSFMALLRSGEVGACRVIGAERLAAVLPSVATTLVNTRRLLVAAAVVVKVTIVLLMVTPSTAPALLPARFTKATAPMLVMALSKRIVVETGHASVKIAGLMEPATMAGGPAAVKLWVMVPSEPSRWSRVKISRV